MLKYLDTHQLQLQYRFASDLGYRIYADTDANDFGAFTLADLDYILEGYDSGLIAHLQSNSNSRTFPINREFSDSELLYKDIQSIFESTHDESEREYVLSKLLLLPVFGSVLDIFSSYRSYILYICNFLKNRCELVAPIIRYNKYCINFIPLTTCTLSRAFVLINRQGQNYPSPHMLMKQLLKRVESIDTEDVIVRFSDRKTRFFRISEEINSIINLNLEFEEQKLLLSVKNLFISIDWVMKHFPGLTEYLIFIRDSFKSYGELTVKGIENTDKLVVEFPNIRHVLGRTCQKFNKMYVSFPIIEPDMSMWNRYFKKKELDGILRTDECKVFRKNFYPNVIQELEKLTALNLSEFELECMLYLLGVRFSNFVITDIFKSSYVLVDFLVNHFRTLDTHKEM